MSSQIFAILTTVLSLVGACFALLVVRHQNGGKLYFVARVKYEFEKRFSRIAWWLRQMQLTIMSAWVLFSKSAGKDSERPVLTEKRDFLRSIVQFWELFRFILPPKTRRESFVPHYNDIKEDYLISLRYKSKWIKRWFCICFLFRTTFMIAECFRVAFGSALKAAALLFVPEALRRVFWWLNK
jgi:hypothetical protein